MQWGIQGRLLATSLFLGSDDCLSMNMNAEGSMDKKELGVKRPCIIPIPPSLNILPQNCCLILIKKKTDCQHSESSEEPSVLVVSLVSGISE